MRNIEMNFDVHPGLGFISRDELLFAKTSIIPVIDHDVYAAEILQMQRHPQAGINGQLARCQGTGNLVGSNPVVVAPGKFTKPLKNAQRGAMFGGRLTSADLQEGFLAP